MADKCWLGNELGPVLYDQFGVALIAAELLTVELGQYVTAMPYAAKVVECQGLAARPLEKAS
jgi:hypothetical protein